MGGLYTDPMIGSYMTITLAQMVYQVVTKGDVVYLGYT